MTTKVTADGTRVQLTTSTHPSYAEILSRLQAGQTFLDAGCCFGQDLRKLLFDGAPSSKAMYGIDIEPAFFQLGYELFHDADTLEASFLEADLIKPQFPLPSLEPIQGRIDVVSAQSLFHLFNLEGQKIVARHLVGLTKPGPGAMIAGRQIGAIQAREGPGLASGRRSEGRRAAGGKCKRGRRNHRSVSSDRRGTNRI
ncbi:hypothetical protein VTN77DRAFT_8220 [Rasamsonia byssochlamydoides]|uniref:uncharacterized protein n=1 Tax=Rasamsonia byssochlamydoides TaxID=89139 RepID=UPI003742A702